MSAIVTLPEPILRERCEWIPESTERDELEAIAFEMIAAMQGVKGVGLAAPQIGRAIRMVVMDPELTGTPTVMVNPILNGIGPSWKWDIERCLSCPGETRRVRRRKAVSVAWYDLNWRAQSRRFNGWSARVAQHELSHLEGELIVDIGRKR